MINQEQNQQQTQTQQRSAPVPNTNKTDRADFVEKIKADLIIDTFRNLLMGKEKVNGKWVQNKGMKDLALSDEGAFFISNQMLALSNMNIQISKIPEDRVRKRLYQLQKEILFSCLGNWEKFGIKNKSQFYFIKSVTFTNALGVLYQAAGGSLQLLFGDILSQNNTVREEPEKTGRIKSIVGAFSRK